MIAVLKIVVHNCRVFSKKHVKKERARERAELAKAWNLLDPVGKGQSLLYPLNLYFLAYKDEPGL